MYPLIIILTLLSSNLLGNDKKFLYGVAPQVRIPLKLEFQPSAVLGSDKFYLGDVADCMGSVQLCQQVTSVLIGDSPRAGDKYSITTQHILSLVREEFANISLTTNEIKSVVLNSETIKIHTDELKHAIIKALHALDPSENRRLKLSRVRVPYDFTIWPGSVAWRIYGVENLSEVMNQAVTKRVKPIPLKVSALSHYKGQRSEAEGVIYAQFIVEHFVPTLVRNLAVNSILTEDDLEYRWLPLQPNIAVGMDEILGKKNRRRLTIGRPIRLSDLKIPYLVRRGESIDVLVHHGMLQVKSKGKALQPARLGDLITIALNNSKKRIQAKVIGKNLAEVEP